MNAWIKWMTDITVLLSKLPDSDEKSLLLHDITQIILNVEVTPVADTMKKTDAIHDRLIALLKGDNTPKKAEQYDPDFTLSFDDLEMPVVNIN